MKVGCVGGADAFTTACIPKWVRAPGGMTMTEGGGGGWAVGYICKRLGGWWLCGITRVCCVGAVGSGCGRRH